MYSNNTLYLLLVFIILSLCIVEQERQRSLFKIPGFKILKKYHKMIAIWQLHDNKYDKVNPLATFYHYVVITNSLHSYTCLKSPNGLDMRMNKLFFTANEIIQDVIHQNNCRDKL